MIQKVPCCAKCDKTDVTSSQICGYNICTYETKYSNNDRVVCNGQGSWLRPTKCKHHQSEPHSYCRHRDSNCNICWDSESYSSHEHIEAHKNDIP